MSTPLYGLWLDIEGWPCLVVGGGIVATRRVRGLLECGARVHVIAMDLISDLEVLAGAGEVEVRRRAYVAEDVAGMRVVIAATSSDEVNDMVCRDARRAGALVNMAGDPTAGDFQVAAVIREGPICVSIGTSGVSPTATKALCSWLATALTPDHKQAVELFGQARGRADLATVIDRASTLLAHGEAAAAARELADALGT